MHIHICVHVYRYKDMHIEQKFFDPMFQVVFIHWVSLFLILACWDGFAGQTWLEPHCCCFLFLHIYIQIILAVGAVILFMWFHIAVTILMFLIISATLGYIRRSDWLLIAHLSYDPLYDHHFPIYKLRF